MTALITIIQFLAIWLAAFAMGYPIIKALAPPDIERDYGAFMAPTAGFLVLCFAAFTISGGFDMPARTACRIVFGVLVVAALAMQAFPRWRIDPRRLASQAGTSLVLALPMAAITLFPLFAVGADTYLGSVNPDYFAGLIDNYFLMSGNSMVEFGSRSKDTFHPIDYAAGQMSVSARFGAELFGIFVQDLLRVDTRTALTLSIGFFLLNLPLTLYVLCRVVLFFEERAARWSAWLIGISGPVGMSAIYFYLGQNSGLPVMPLLLTSIFLMLTRPGIRTLLLCALLSNALFVNYFAMLPFALTPGAVLALYLLFTRRLSWKLVLALAVGFVAMSLLLKMGTLGFTFKAMRGWMSIIGQTLQGQFFLEFLTEAWFAYFLGVYNYPSNHWYGGALGATNVRVVGVIVGAALFLLYLACVARWARDTREKASRVFVVAAIIIYSLVWARYTFLVEYGYAVFKMAAWLQFILVPFFAFGLDRALRMRRATPAAAGAAPAPGRARSTVVIAGCALYALLNLVTAVVYARDAFGRNTVSGYIVNHFGLSGNRDFFELEAALKRYVRPDQSVGFVFTDWIRNYWTSYYTRPIRQSWMAHEMMPGDDENLPDIETRNVVDYYGNVRKVENPYFHGGANDDFYLTWGDADLNHDITERKFSSPPIWGNSTFRLYPASAVHDLLFTGYGFYRLEYRHAKDYFIPNPMRWSADGGEFYLLRPGKPGEPYRLAFDVLVGYEYPSDSRTLEIWVGDRLHDEIRVDSTARVMTKPFIPDPGVTRIVVKVKERNRAAPRPLGLWNTHLPADYRRLNVAFANARVLPPGAPLPDPPARGKAFPFLEWHNVAYSFNGLEVDGWIDRRAQLALTVPEGATALMLSGMAAGNLGLKYPMDITLSVNGRAERRTLAPGPFTLEVALRPGERLADIVLETPQSADTGEGWLRAKTVRRSLRLEAFTFK